MRRDGCHSTSRTTANTGCISNQRNFGVLNAGIWGTYARVICIDTENIEKPGCRATIRALCCL